MYVVAFAFHPQSNSAALFQFLPSHQIHFPCQNLLVQCFCAASFPKHGLAAGLPLTLTYCSVPPCSSSLCHVSSASAAIPFAFSFWHSPFAAPASAELSEAELRVPLPLFGNAGSAPWNHAAHCANPQLLVPKIIFWCLLLLSECGQASALCCSAATSHQHVPFPFASASAVIQQWKYLLSADDGRLFLTAIDAQFGTLAALQTAGLPPDVQSSAQRISDRNRN
mmetsp:Transcript_112200/g.194825  ORF Transcript_112200/g.194825 Transcript_112200/m.194825 type:complete len:224 (-) Transcript_112200:2066-2737(-)